MELHAAGQSQLAVSVETARGSKAANSSAITEPPPTIRIAA
jgi:hypothetical protein